MRNQEPPASAEPPRCNVCDELIEYGNEATDQGVDLCDDHATEENIERFLDFKRESSGISCAVCGRHLLKREAERVDSSTYLCDNHDRDALKKRHERDEDARRQNN